MDYSFFLIGVSSGSLCLSHSISICNIRVHCILHLFFGATCHRVTKIHKSIIMIKNMKLSWNSNGCYHMIFACLPMQVSRALRANYCGIQDHSLHCRVMGHANIAELPNSQTLQASNTSKTLYTQLFIHSILYYFFVILTPQMPVP